VSEMERIQGIVHDIQVVDRGSIKYMRFGSDGGWQGALDTAHPLRPVFPYQRAFAALLPAFRRNPLQFLAIGVGTGTCLRTVDAQFPESELWGVELDEVVLETAMYRFDAPSHRRATYFVGDGLEFLQQTQDKFSLIFVDAYMSNRIYAPMLKTTVPDLIADVLLPGGVACFNLITTVPPTDKIAAWATAAKEFFPEIYFLPVGVPYSEQNVLAIFSLETLPLQRLSQLLRTNTTLTLWERLSWPFRLVSY